MRFLTSLVLVSFSVVSGNASPLVRRRPFDNKNDAPSTAVTNVSTKTAVPLHLRFLGSPKTSEATETRVSELCKAFAPTRNGNDVDASRLLKACNVFERAMRRVGETNSARDLHNNIQKLQHLYDEAPASSRHTIKDLLGYEKNLGVHPEPHRRLKDPSGAMGLLWIRRSLAFQTSMYSHILQHWDDNCHDDNNQDDDNTMSVQAGMAAYQQELKPYHGWALQRIYTYAIQRNTPPPREILARIGGFKQDDFGAAQEAATRQEMTQLLDIWKPLIAVCKKNFVELGLDDTRQV